MPIALIDGNLNVSIVKKTRSNASAPAGKLIITNEWDNHCMCGSGSFDLWKFGDKYYVAMDDLMSYEEELPDPDSLAAMEGPFDSIAALLEENAGSILSIGPATESVKSRIHTVSELRKLLRVEPCLLEGVDDLDEWFIKINGVKHRVDAKTYEIKPVRRKSMQSIKGGSKLDRPPDACESMDPCDTSAVIQVGYQRVSQQAFSEALWCILAKDHFGASSAIEAHEATDLVTSIRIHFSVEVALIVNRPSLAGDERDAIGVCRCISSQQNIVFWASDASGTVEMVLARPGAAFSSSLLHLFKAAGANLCQISSTTILNQRPDLLTKADLTAFIERLISDEKVGWADVGDDTGTTAAFLERNYSECIAAQESR